jgi:sugar phosphate isomerase/epimerase
MLGAQLFTVMKYTQTIPDIAKTLEKIANIGYDGVQISAIGRVDPEKVAELVKDTGLKVAGTHFDWNRFLNDLDGIIAEHKMWNCNHAATGGLPSSYYSLEGINQFLKELEHVTKKLASWNIDFSYHNHNHELSRCGKKSWLEILYERANPKMLKAELDVYWIQAGGGDPVFWIKKCAGREPMIHLKDMTVTSRGEQRYAEIGEGNMNWPVIIKTAKKSGVEWYLVEQDNCYDRNPFDSLTISYNNLKALGLS